MNEDGFTINDSKEYNENILLAIIREIEKEDDTKNDDGAEPPVKK